MWTSTKAVEIEFEQGSYHCRRWTQHGSPKSRVVGCEQTISFVEERRGGIEVVRAEPTVDELVDRWEHKLEHWKTVGSW